MQPAPGDDQFDAVYMPYTTTQRLLNLSKLNDITVTAESSGDVSRLSREITRLLRARHGEIMASNRSRSPSVTSTPG